MARRARALRRIFYQFQPIVIQSDKALDVYRAKEREARTKAKQGENGPATMIRHWEKTAEFYVGKQEEETIFHDEIDVWMLGLEADMKKMERELRLEGYDPLVDAPRLPVHPMHAYDEPVDVVEKKFARLEELEKKKD
jgi:hypothetical protein